MTSKEALNKLSKTQELKDGLKRLTEYREDLHTYILKEDKDITDTLVMCRLGVIEDLMVQFNIKSVGDLYMHLKYLEEVKGDY